MAERNAQFLQIGLGHIAQDLEIDGILRKGGRILGEPDPIKPSRYLVVDAHCRVPFPTHQKYCSFLVRRLPQGGRGHRFPLPLLHITARAVNGHSLRATEKGDELAPP
jgi:hypothetical protein